MSSYELLFNQNNNFQKKIREQNQTGSTFIQKNNFLNERFNLIQTINFVFFIIYYICVFILFIFLFQTKKLNRIVKFFLFLFFGIFPFIIYTIENQFYYFGLYIYSLLFGKVYTPQ
jgi:hypothetical protein